MATIVFDGQAFARKREQKLQSQVQPLNFTPRIASVWFEEDEPSQLYTRLKKEAAVRVGIEFDEEQMSITDPLELIKERITTVSNREDVHGILIQKPGKKIWRQSRPINYQSPVTNFSSWWQLLTSAITVAKDVDCLTKQNLDLVYTGQWQILPATVKAVILILEQALNISLLDPRSGLAGQQIAILGRSDIVGRPLAEVLNQFGAQVELCGSKTLNLKAKTSSADIIISATGKQNLVTTDMVKDRAIVIDVGSTKGDVDFESVKEKTAFITPVPRGVGPVTVVCLLENLIRLVT